MTRRKSKICPELVGELFLKPGEDIPYRLTLCNTEPTAQIQRVDRTTPEDIVGISGLRGLVLLKPVRPIEIPKPDKPRKQRSDKGRTHTKAPVDLTPDPRKSKAKLPGEIDIEKIGLAVAHDDQPAWATYKDIAASNPTLRGAALDLFVGLGIAGAEKVIEYVKAQPDSPHKTILINALGG